MKNTTNSLLAAMLLGSALVQNPAHAGNGTPINAASADPMTMAVFGDWPYSQELLGAAPLLIASINDDPKVRLVMHVGDIHSGSMPCTGAGLDPLPATAEPAWNRGIFDLFAQFRDPLVYTPGDNEWSDCHKKKEGASGYPRNELAALRSLFFATPGYTLGGRGKQVLSQAQAWDPAHPADAQFVENVMWEQSQVVFATFNMPGGSNDDRSPWSAPFSDPAAQAQEYTERDAANLRWLQRTFGQAEADGAKAVVIGLQADMWDSEAIAPGGAGLDNYTPFVQALADLAVAFGRPVLLLNGDSHKFEADQPLADPTTALGMIHATQAVPNLTRITVQGANNTPREWLRLTIDPRTPQVFTWQNVVYCDGTTCP